MKPSSRTRYSNFGGLIFATCACLILQNRAEGLICQLSGDLLAWRNQMIQNAFYQTYVNITLAANASLAKLVPGSNFSLTTAIERAFRIPYFSGLLYVKDWDFFWINWNTSTYGMFGPNVSIPANVSNSIATSYIQPLHTAFNNLTKYYKYPFGMFRPPYSLYSAKGIELTNTTAVSDSNTLTYSSTGNTAPDSSPYYIPEDDCYATNRYLVNVTIFNNVTVIRTVTSNTSSQIFPVGELFDTVTRKFEEYFRSSTNPFQRRFLRANVFAYMERTLDRNASALVELYFVDAFDKFELVKLLEYEQFYNSLRYFLGVNYTYFKFPMVYKGELRLYFPLIMNMANATTPSTATTTITTPDLSTVTNATTSTVSSTSTTLNRSVANATTFTTSSTASTPLSMTTIHLTQLWNTTILKIGNLTTTTAVLGKTAVTVTPKATSATLRSITATLNAFNDKVTTTTLPQNEYDYYYNNNLTNESYSDQNFNNFSTVNLSPTTVSSTMFSTLKSTLPTTVSTTMSSTLPSTLTSFKNGTINNSGSFSTPTKEIISTTLVSTTTVRNVTNTKAASTPITSTPTSSSSSAKITDSTTMKYLTTSTPMTTQPSTRTTVLTTVAQNSTTISSTTTERWNLTSFSAKLNTTIIPSSTISATQFTSTSTATTRKFTNTTVVTTNTTRIPVNLTTFDPDPLFKPVAPVIRKVYNDKILIQKFVTMPSVTERKFFYTVTVPAGICMVLFSVMCLFCLNIDCVQPRKRKESEATKPKSTF